MIDTYDQKKYVKCLISATKHSSNGTMKEKLKVSEQKEIREDTYFPVFHPVELKPYQEKEKSAIVEYPRKVKRMTLKDKNSISEQNIQTMKSSQISDLDSTSTVKVLTPFWNQQSKEISQKLWLPTEIDYVDSVLVSSKESSLKIPMGQSWFSIKEKHPQKKNLLMTSFQSSQYSLPDSMVSEVIHSGKKSENVRTLKMRIFPTKVQTEKLKLMFEQFRWYYNDAVYLVNTMFPKDTRRKQLSYPYIRDKIISSHHYEEKSCENGSITFIDNIPNENDEKKIPVPSFWKNNIHTRIPRGAIKKFTGAWNSAVTLNKKKHFSMNFQTKKNNTENVFFEDEGFPKELREIKSRYWYSTKDRKRITMSFSDIFNSTKKRGLEIIHEKPTGKYFLYYVVDRDWFPVNDKRNENQVTLSSDRIIALDPGVRKFLTGYDPHGKISSIAEEACIDLKFLLKQIDKKDTYSRRMKIKNMVRELHWKVINYLVSKYDIILLPIFKVSKMMRNEKLNDMTKRQMQAFSFYAFRQKLQYKCDVHKKKLIVVNEDYTTKTCGVCGTLNDIGSCEEYHCTKCGLRGDRDSLAARNILIKNIRYAEPFSGEGN